MAVQYYPAVITRDQRKGGTGTYTIQFVDIPGAISWGNSIGEAITHGREAAALALEGEEDIPASTPFDEVPARMKAAGRKGATIFQIVDVPLPEPTVRVNVTLPGDLVKRIDSVAGNYGRSDFLATAAREKLAGTGIPKPSRNKMARRAEAMASKAKR